jgi:anti-sigma factor RsiW
MNCETMRECLIDFVDGELGESLAAECRAHLSDCGACARDVSHHRATAQLLGEQPPLGEEPSEAIAPARLRQMAATALAKARAEPDDDGAAGARPLPRIGPAKVGLLRRRYVQVAAAAAFVLAAAFGTELLLRRNAVTSDDAPPPFVSDPEFVGNFDVLRDMPLADSSDGELLDLDHDQLVMLQLLEDA